MASTNCCRTLKIWSRHNIRFAHISLAQSCALRHQPTAAAPLTISEISRVIAAWRALLYTSLSSPITLFAVLAVINQAARNFAMEQKSREILLLLENMRKQWQLYLEKCGQLDTVLLKAREHFDELMETRKKQLDRVFNKIAGVRSAQANEQDQAINAGPIEGED